MTIQFHEAKEIEKAMQWLNEYWDKPTHPEYHSVTTLEDALALLDQHGEAARIFAAGIDLIGLMKGKIQSPGVLVNIKPIRKMKHIAVNPAGIAIGSLTLICDLVNSPLIKRQYPLLFEAARSIASPHIRNMATIGGNLCQETRCWYFRRPPDTGISFDCRRKNEHGTCYALNGENQYHTIMGDRTCVSVCPSDMATVLLAMDAGVKTADKNGGRFIPIDKLYTTFGTTLKAGEIITTVEIPESGSDVKQRFIKFRIRKTIDFAIASVAANIKLDGGVVKAARIALGGVSQKPLRAEKAEKLLIGERITETLAAEAAKASVNDAKPLSKNGYKVPIVEALVKRAILE